MQGDKDFIVGTAILAMFFIAFSLGAIVASLIWWVM
jgi:hypothetical protein